MARKLPYKTLAKEFTTSLHNKVLSNGLINLIVVHIQTLT